MIDFVYFDVGGVVVKDFSASSKWDLLRQDVGIENKDKKKFDAIWRDYEKEICTSLPVDNMIPLLEKEFAVHIPKGHSILGNFVKYFEKNGSIWPIVEEMSKTVKIGLLTSMYVGMFKEIIKKDILPHIVWNTIIDSSVVGFAKPDRKIFEIAEEEAQVKPASILFVENNQHNIEVAKSLGWQTFFYDSADYEKSSKELEEFAKGLSII